MGGGSVQHGGHMHMGKQEQCEWVRAGQVDEGCGVGDVDARRTMRGRWRAAKRPAIAAQLLAAGRSRGGAGLVKRASALAASAAQAHHTQHEGAQRGHAQQGHAQQVHTTRAWEA